MASSDKVNKTIKIQMWFYPVYLEQKATQWTQRTPLKKCKIRSTRDSNPESGNLELQLETDFNLYKSLSVNDKRSAFCGEIGNYW